MRLRFFLLLLSLFRFGFFADDGGTGGGSGAGAGDAGSAGDDGDDGSGDGSGDNGSGDGDSGADDGPVAFTPAQQAHIDKLIAKTTAKSKGQAEKDLKTWLEQQGLEGEERAKAEKAAAEAERDAARAEVLATKIETSAERAALAAGVKPDRIDRFMRLVDLSDNDELTADGKPDSDAIKAAVAKALADVPEFKGAAGKGGSSGTDDMNGNGDKKTWTREEISKLSIEDFEKHEAEINEALTGGRVN